jgi:hypothetical protein
MTRESDRHRWSRDPGSTASSQYVVPFPCAPLVRLLTVGRYNSGSSRDYTTSDNYYRNYNRFRHDDSYPPKNSALQARCEDEVVSLAREFRPPKPDHTEVPNRGEINQEPLLETLVNLERRFVLVPESNKPQAKKGRNEKSRGPLRDKPRDIPSLKIDTEAEPLLDRRKPMPYSMTNKTKESLLSPGNLAAHPGAMPRSVPNDSGIEYMRNHRRNKSSVSLNSANGVSTDGEESDYNRLPKAKDARKTKHEDGLGPRSSGRDTDADLPRLEKQTSRSGANQGRNRVESVRYTSSPKSSPPPSPRVDDLRPQDGRSNSRSHSPATAWDPIFQFENEAHPPNYTLPTHPKSTQAKAVPTSNRPDPARPDPARKASGLPYPDISSKGGALPYPDDDHPIIMPTEEHFPLTSPVLPSKPFPSLSRSVSSSAQPPPRSSRPSLPRAASVQVPSKTSTIPQSPSIGKLSSSSDSLSPSNELPPCPRRSYVIGLNDWYTIDGFPNFDACPSCLERIANPSIFRRHFVPAANRATQAIRCDFGNPWFRCAWLLTMKEKRRDLNLIKELCRSFSNYEPCPENQEGLRSWYGLRDEKGSFIPNFYICPRDKSCMEVLFPSLIGMFSRRYTSPSSQMCAFRTESTRFPIFLDVLDAINEAAMRKSIAASSRSRTSVPIADMSQFIELVMTLATIPECPRSRPSPQLTWHYIPSEPEITVCSECFDSVIGPDARRHVPLATMFVSSPRPVTAGSSSSRLPSLQPTCQMYSDRMRGIWAVAVEDMDPEYYLRKAKERRYHECSIAEKLNKLKMLLADITRGDYPGTTMDKERLKREIARLESEWGQFE